jgi:hypothetical protein
MPVKIKDFRQYEKNTLKGFVTVILEPTGIEIRDLTLHQKGDRRWLNMPAKPYQDDEGETRYSYIVFFPDKKRAEQFQEAALMALEEYQQPVPEPEPAPATVEDDLPF